MAYLERYVLTNAALGSIVILTSFLFIGHSLCRLMSIIVCYGTYINTRAELSLEAGRVVSHWGRVVSLGPGQVGPGRVVLDRVVGGPSCLTPGH